MAFDDFAPYNASYTAAASFIATLIISDGQPIAALIFQMPVDRINSVMTSDEAWRDVRLGESGETCLVGPDHRLRSESRFLVEDRGGLLEVLEQIGASDDVLQHLQTGSGVGAMEIKTEGTAAALSGNTGEKIIADYRGVPVLSAYAAIYLSGTQWALMSEVDEAEIFKPVFDLRSRLILIIVVVLVLGALIGVFVARSISRPLIEVTDRLSGLADGDLTASAIPDPGGDEIGDLQRAYNTLVASLHELVSGMQENAGQLNVTAAELLATSQEQQTGVTEQASAVEETKQTLESLLTSAREVAGVSQTVFDNAEVTQKNASVIAG